MSVPRTFPFSLPIQLLLAMAGNTVIAVFLTAVDGESLRINFIYSQCIGTSSFSVARLLALLRGEARYRLGDGLWGTFLGGAAGFLLGTWANGFTLMAVFAHSRAVDIAAAATLFFGLLSTYLLISRERLAEVEEEAAKERLKRVEQEALATATELRLLQAQIEPHFLFNTLANVISLVESDPATAKRMLLALTALLRGSLTRARKAEITLGEELEMLKEYLSVMEMRMGGRLAWTIEAEGASGKVFLPPLLVQPLVENAVRHGLEPKAEGGRLSIRVRRRGDMLEIAVEDDGMGLGEGGKPGVGLANVRQRLTACYGDQARLELAPLKGGGTRALLSLPVKEAES